MSIENIGTSPAGENTATEAVYGSSGAAPTGTAFKAGDKGTSTDAPGGSVTDVIPNSGGSETGPIDSGYAVTQPDTEATYGGTAPPFVPTVVDVGSAAMPAIIDTTIGGGAVRTDGTPPVYRPPSAYVAATQKDTSLTDILGNQINAPLPVNSAAYVATNIDTSYSGGPSVPSPLLTQTDVFTSQLLNVPVYLSQLGVMPSTIVVTDTTAAATLTLNTDYTLTTAGNGATTAAFVTLLSGHAPVSGHNISIAYSYGDPLYYDSNFPAGSAQSVTDTLYFSSSPTTSMLKQQGVTTAAGSLTVVDLTNGNSLTVNTDYTVATRFLASGSGSTAASLKTYVLTRVVTSPNCSIGDTISVTYSYTTSVPAAPGMGAQLPQVDTITLNHSVAATLSKTGIVTTAAGLVVFDTTTHKTLVMGTDYTVATVGSGSTVSYTITRINASTNSADSDSATVTYGYGNAFYFGSGPVVAAYRGVVVPWTPPAGTTPVDFYFVQCSTGGTMYVPATGQPMLDGQPSPSGGADSGEPTFQSDVISLSHTIPATLSQTGIITPDGQLVVRDTTTGLVLYETIDYTVATVGVGPWKTYTITRVNSSQNSADGDSATVAYWWSSPTAFQAFFTQGLVESTAKIYNPDGTVRSFQGYQFSVAAGNRAGLGAFSAWSDFAIPLNPNVVPGFTPQQSVHPNAGLDPANTINPVYRPDGTVKAGTGLGG